jgi:hypothetical protein
LSDEVHLLAGGRGASRIYTRKKAQMRRRETMTSSP